MSEETKTQRVEMFAQVRQVKYVDRITYSFAGAVMPHALTVGDCDNGMNEHHSCASRWFTGMIIIGTDGWMGLYCVLFGRW